MSCSEIGVLVVRCNFRVYRVMKLVYLGLIIYGLASATFRVLLKFIIGV
jgi:hypothetical protein